MSDEHTCRNGARNECYCDCHDDDECRCDCCQSNDTGWYASNSDEEDDE